MTAKDEFARSFLNDPDDVRVLDAHVQAAIQKAVREAKQRGKSGVPAKPILSVEVLAANIHRNIERAELLGALTSLCQLAELVCNAGREKADFSDGLDRFLEDKHMRTKAGHMLRDFFVPLRNAVAHPPNATAFILEMAKKGMPDAQGAALAQKILGRPDIGVGGTGTPTTEMFGPPVVLTDPFVAYVIKKLGWLLAPLLKKNAPAGKFIGT